MTTLAVLIIGGLWMLAALYAQDIPGLLPWNEEEQFEDGSHESLSDEFNQVPKA